MINDQTIKSKLKLAEFYRSIGNKQQANHYAKQAIRAMEKKNGKTQAG